MNPENTKAVTPRKTVGDTLTLPCRQTGLDIQRYFTLAATGERVDPYSTVEWASRTVTDRPNATAQSEPRTVEAPASWSQNAVDLVATKYMRRRDVPLVSEHGQPLRNPDGTVKTGAETSVRRVVQRLTGFWRAAGEDRGYFRTAEAAQAFEDELAYMLVHQMAAPNSPQWFNSGLAHAYGIRGTAQGHYYVDPESGEARPCPDIYSHPQVSACFIQSVKDDLLGEGGIMDLWTREARLFKFGSGSGTNFSSIRGAGEPLGSGGASSGLMSFLNVGDRAAGAIKSGGTTRRAAKMVLLDVDHPDIEPFIRWKLDEEYKAQALIRAGYSPDFEGPAYTTVSGQNSNNSVRVSAAFMRAVEKDGTWELRNRVDGSVSKVVSARGLFQQIALAAHTCADPGTQFDTTINEWHTCPESGRINASNPCAEYVFLDDTACNLASINIVKFLSDQLRPGRFNVAAFQHAVALWTIVLNISADAAGYPTKDIAERTHEFKTVGLGYCGLGALLMRAAIPYDSQRGRSVAGVITALMTGTAYATSAELAAELGSYPAFGDLNRDHHLRVVRNHRAAVRGAPDSDYEGLSVIPQGLRAEHTPAYLLDAAKRAWDRALHLGERYGYRNAQVTVLAPTGTIGPVMDCDTTGLEPLYAIRTFKKLAGGGQMVLPSTSIAPALQSLRYPQDQIDAILAYVDKTGSISGAPHLRDRDRAVFACALDIPPEAHIRMMAAVQPFLSGAISKTVNMPRETTPEQIADTFLRAWRLGLKSVAIFRDGSKGQQILESLRTSDYEPPPCPTCGDGLCELPAPGRRRAPADDRWAAIPAALRAAPYVAYSSDKVPFDPKSGRPASVTRPATWATFEEAVEFCKVNPRMAGPGVVLTPESGLVCIDLDNVIRPGVDVAPFAERLIEDFATFTEMSLSGRGIHIFLKTSERPTFPGGRWIIRDDDGEHAIEIYYAARYIALTGQLWRFSGAGRNVEDRTEVLAKLIAGTEPERKAPAAAPGERRANTKVMLSLFRELGVVRDADPYRQLQTCPFHQDDHPSLSISERGHFCFGCNRGGGAVALKETIRNLADAEIDAVSRRTGTEVTRLLALRERLRMEARPRR